MTQDFINVSINVFSQCLHQRLVFLQICPKISEITLSSVMIVQMYCCILVYVSVFETMWVLVLAAYFTMILVCDISMDLFYSKMCSKSENGSNLLNFCYCK